MAEFSSVLDTPVGEAKPPVPAPTGEYLLRVKEHNFGESSLQKTPYMRAIFTIVEPGDGVDPEAFAALEDKDRNRTIRRDFYLTQDAGHHLDKFLQECGCSPEDGKTIRQAIDEDLDNSEVIGYIAHRPSNREGDTTVYTDITSFRKVE